MLRGLAEQEADLLEALHEGVFARHCTRGEPIATRFNCRRGEVIERTVGRMQSGVGPLLLFRRARLMEWKCVMMFLGLPWPASSNP